MLANPPVSRAPYSPLVRPKFLIFTLVGIMTAYVLAHDERFLIEPANPLWKHYASIKWWLIPHAFAGTCAVIVAPLQFSDRLRRRYTKLHRVMGRLYVAGVFVLAPLGAYTQWLEEGTLGGTRSFTVLTIVNVILLVVPTAIALRFAMKRNITLHRQWMVRSYAVALVFFEGRFINGMTGLEQNPQMVEVVIWSCLVFSILFADLVIQGQERRGAR
jgi:uncharacterized membrane protein